MSRYTDQFDSICGNCAGIDMLTVTDDDVREQAKRWNEQTMQAEGEDSDIFITDEQIVDAIRGLDEYKDAIVQAAEDEEND